MSFNRSTTVVQSGLGDEQYQVIQGNQTGIGTQLEEGFGGVGTRFNEVDTGITGLKTDIGSVTTDVNANTNTGFTDLGSTLSGYNDANNLRFDEFGRSFTTNEAAVGANNTALNTLQGDVTGGFDAQGNRFDQVDAANTAIQGDVTAGFSDQAQGFTDAQADRTTNAGALAEGLVGAGAAIDAGFLAGEGQVGQLSSDVLAGQATAATNLDALNTGFNSYTAQDATDQAAMKTTQDGFVSSFDAYTDRYTEDTALANQTRTDIQDANTNATSRIREDIGAYAGAAETQLGNVATGVDNQINALEGTVEGGFIASNANTSAGFSGVAADAQANNASVENTMAQNQAANASASELNRTTTNNAATDLQASLAGGIENITSEQVVAARDMASIASTQGDLSLDLRQNFNQLGTAFDDSGNLIASSIDAQGNTINRKMDQQGNLILDRFDVTGAALGQKVLNINQTLTDLGNVKNMSGANVSMGNLTAASSGEVPESGFASAFTTTS